VGQATQRFSQQLVDTYNYSPSTANEIATQYAREAIGADVDANLGSVSSTPQQRADLVDTVFRGATPGDAGTVDASVTNRLVQDQLRQIGFDQARAASVSNTLVPVTTGGTTAGGTAATDTSGAVDAGASVDAQAGAGPALSFSDIGGSLGLSGDSSLVTDVRNAANRVESVFNKRSNTVIDGSFTKFESLINNFLING
jgi:hypothetical protein